MKKIAGVCAVVVAMSLAPTDTNGFRLGFQNARGEGDACPAGGGDRAPTGKSCARNTCEHTCGDNDSSFVPRFTLLEGGYPQGVAASAGLWWTFARGRNYNGGVVLDVEMGLSGATLAIGPGFVSAATVSYEHARSFGIQALFHRTWPWWSPWLPESTNLIGAELFVHLFALRGSFGLAWKVHGAVESVPVPIVSLGVGLP